jgi:MYXO-CTERM domain-containing protein
MKRTVLAFAASLALVSVVPARAFTPPPRYYPGDKGTANVPSSVPEPGTFGELAVGLIALGGLAFVARKRSSRLDSDWLGS